MTVLITGGTGTLGKALAQRLLDTTDATVRLFSRDEDKHRLARQALRDPDGRVRYVVGDVRDAGRLETAMRGAVTVIHAAALKQVPILEYNPSEAVKTNVVGTLNVIDAALRQPTVGRVMLVSTDKATAALNLYGSTKHTAEKLMQAANVYAGGRDLRFGAVRYGNVTGSRGSVLHVWRDAAERGLLLPLTDARMTRFWLTLDGAVDFVLSSLDLMAGGEVWVPDLASYRVLDLMAATAPKAAAKEIGIRPGEKLHEVLVSEDEAPTCWRVGDRYALIPPQSADLRVPVPEIAEPVGGGFRLRSDDEDRIMRPGDLAALVRPYLRGCGVKRDLWVQVMMINGSSWLVEHEALEPLREAMATVSAAMGEEVAKTYNGRVPKLTPVTVRTVYDEPITFQPAMIVAVWETGVAHIERHRRFQERLTELRQPTKAGLRR